VDGRVVEREIDPQELGIEPCDAEQLHGGTPAENAAVVRAVFEGRDRGARRSAIVLNAAGAIAAAGHAADLREGLAAAGGTLDDLRAARAATRAPLLAKGFFRELEQLKELKAAGADAVLVILRDVDDGRAAQLMTYARALGLDALVEAHDEDELQRAVALGADPIGVN